MKFERSKKAKFGMRLIDIHIIISDNQHIIFTIFEPNLDTLITQNQQNWRPNFVTWLIYLFKTVKTVQMTGKFA